MVIWIDTLCVQVHTIHNVYPITLESEGGSLPLSMQGEENSYQSLFFFFFESSTNGYLHISYSNVGEECIYHSL